MGLPDLKVARAFDVPSLEDKFRLYWFDDDKGAVGIVAAVKIIDRWVIAWPIVYRGGKEVEQEMLIYLRDSFVEDLWSEIMVEDKDSLLTLTNLGFLVADKIGHKYHMVWRV